MTALSASISVRQAKVLCYIFLVAAPFVHFGSSEYISVSFFVFMATLLVTIISNPGLVFRLSLLSLPILASALLFLIFTQDLSGFLVNVREISVIFLICVLAASFSGGVTVSKSALSRLAIFVLAIAFLQFVDARYFGSGIFFIPAYFYNLDYGTLASSFFDQGVLLSRATATFSEPSSLGGFGLIVFFIGASLSHRFLMVLGSFVVLLSMSLSAIFSFVILSAFFIKGARLYIVFLAALVAVFSGYLISERLVGVFGGGDESALQRVYYPFLVLVDGFSFSGIDKDIALAKAISFGASKNIFDNFIIGKSILSGLYVIPLFIWMFAIFRLNFMILIICFCFINGSPFYYDRFVWYGLVAVFLGEKVIRNRVLKWAWGRV